VRMLTEQDLWCGLPLVRLTERSHDGVASAAEEETIVSTSAGVPDAARGEERRPVVVPTAPREREPVLDVLRGVALLGILLINIEYMRGSDFFAAFVGEARPARPLTVSSSSGWAGWRPASSCRCSRSCSGSAQP
jgi:hypothetical protein